MSRTIIREPECKRRTGLARTTRWRLERKGRFPKRVLLDPANLAWNSPTGWFLDEIDAWVATRVRVASYAEQKAGREARVADDGTAS